MEHDEGVELLLQEISRTIADNNRFLHALKTDQPELDDRSERLDGDTFEEL